MKSRAPRGHVEQSDNDLFGTVVAAFGRSCVVEVTAPSGKRETVRCHLRGRKLKPVCGDRVRWRAADAADGIVEEIETRTNHFPRVLPNGRLKIVAANVDCALITVAARPAPTKDLINRYLVACHSVSVDPIIVFNKVDLLDEQEMATWNKRASLYRSLGYPVYLVSAKEPPSVVVLKQVLVGKRGILVGQSGVGKSSLTNLLVPGANLAIATLSTATHKGTHTTTSSTLHHLPEGGELIDSPGVWEYGIWNMPAADVAAGFREFEPYLGQCRFTDCSHVHEPGCAISRATEDGLVEASRHASYQRIVVAAAS